MILKSFFNILIKEIMATLIITINSVNRFDKSIEVFNNIVYFMYRPPIIYFSNLK